MPGRITKHCHRRMNKQNYNQSWEEYRRRKEREFRRKMLPYRIGFIVGIIMAATGFTLEFLGILDNAGIIVGVLGIVATLLSAFLSTVLGTQLIVGEIREGIWGVRRDIRDVREDIREDIRNEGNRVIGEIKKILP